MSKLTLDGDRLRVPVDRARRLGAAILGAVGVDADIADTVAEHLVDADLCGVESHGTWRLTQYVGYYESGYLDPKGRPELRENGRGGAEVFGHGGIGMPAMRLATEHVCAQAGVSGIAAIAIREVGHTGRLGAYAETAALAGRLLIVIGGGGRENWRLVAPHGGRRAMLSTNPYCIGVPGGERGPVILDCATSAIAGGWVYAARQAGALVPEGALIDAEGRPTRDPEAYFQGGAILPMAGAKGYAMAVAAEMIAEALLGPATTECNWLAIALDCGRWREAGAITRAAEEILAELRACPPAPGHARVEIPGERERGLRADNIARGLALPETTWNAIRALAERLGVGDAA